MGAQARAGSVLVNECARPHLWLERTDAAYGGWTVPTTLIRSDWRCYRGGVGEDVSFDLGQIERYGCDVFAFDPTPRAIAYAEPIARSQPLFRFTPVGPWSRDVTLRFYGPKNQEHISQSVVNLQGTSNWFEAQCRSLPSLIAELGHEVVDVVQLDIEGAEDDVLKSMLGAGILPPVLC